VYIIRLIVSIVLFFLLTGNIFSQDRGTDEFHLRGSIPEELLRPNRNEAPRYPMDTVIGPIGQGQTQRDAYNFARRVAAALLEGNPNAAVLATVNRVFLESCLNALDVISPRFFRLGSGRTEPDGSVSFLVRFVGAFQGITGELFIRLEERPVFVSPPVIENTVIEDAETEIFTDMAAPDTGEAHTVSHIEQTVQVETPEIVPPPVITPTETRWVFEDLILEEPRSREEENRSERQRFDFSPYERIF
jgi:hypothetical protein